MRHAHAVRYGTGGVTVQSVVRRRGGIWQSAQVKRLLDRAQ